MALQIWLPLNGDLTNNGITNANITNSNATISNDGKIGKCYSFNGNSQKLTSTLPSSISSSIGTLACWIKFNAFPASGKWMCLMQLGTSGGFASCRLGVYMEYTNGINICIDGSTNAENLYTHSLSTNTWYHLCATNDGTNVKLYLNGEVVLSKIATKGTYATSASNLYIGGTNNYYLNGCLNDIRYYDTCLSPKEVEILARGLVLHYPLSLPMPNLAKGSNTDSTSTNSFGFSEATGGSTRTIEYDGGIPCAKITRNSTAHGSWSFLWYSNWDRSAIKPSTTYTLSFDIIGSGSGTIGFSGFMQGNATNNISASVETIQNTFSAGKWSHLVFRTTTIADFTDKGTGQTIYMNCSYLHNTNVWIMMKNMKLEEGVNDTPWVPHTSDVGYSTMGLGSTTEYDVSGNKYHGIKTNVTYDSDTPRYATSTKVTTTSGVFSRPSITFDKFTIAFWGKHTASNKMLMGSCPDISTSNTTWYWYGDNSFKYPSGEFYYEHNAGTYTLNTWMHFAVTYDGSNIKVYRNGVYEGSKSATGNMTLDYLSVGRGYGSNYAEAGNVSDFRLYATALSAEDIQKLYNTSASISNSGTLMGYELIEN